MEIEGLFVIPLQSNVTGSRYSYTWMSLVQENGWHVLLDATALGAKEMETLRLSVFDLDFHICSFFRVFFVKTHQGFAACLSRNPLVYLF
ncbi:hypothetical protein Goshw_009471 [Gossypium schwendimanii]|uniref:Aminotransferase class V domain-containing protein n=1 Tax=Gossypium schwendimanii TaxID=34291 RepID=A0A7J9KR63_GOSSC|nr:hypothetical protein [Gossypium schwendimanii]